MEKRTFIKLSAAFAASAVGSSLLSACGASRNTVSASTPPPPPPSAPKSTQNLVSVPVFELPPLGYNTSALEPLMDTKTLEIHHGKHHAAYVKNLNAALVDLKVPDASLTGLLTNVTADQAAIRNHGGGHYNHMLYWRTMQPGGAPKPGNLEVGKAINDSFGSFEAMNEKLTKAAASVFGSGWAWLAVGKDKKLFICTTPNQDNPLMAQLVKEAGKPILGIDVWEHAYYLKHQNKRADYVTNFMQLINWDVVNQEFKM
jgi:superoxide dismutase, Fe-Mn family